jgi:class 3 adenylate cyclase
MRDENTTELLEELIPYVAPLVIRRLSRASYSLSKPAAELYSAAVLFADIKGFSELAEGLERRGPSGAEELAQILNSYFKQLIAIISDHGGEITKFAGDALLAIWPVPTEVSRIGKTAREMLANMVLQATECALDIQRQTRNPAPIDGSEPLFQIGIGAGDIYSVHVGGYLGRWEFLLSGDPLIQMSRAKDFASSGEVVLSPEAWSLIQGSCTGKTIESRFVKISETLKQASVLPATDLPTSDTITPGLRAYVPAAITRRIESGFGAWLSEIRHITVLFVTLPDYGTSITHPFATTIPEAQAVMRAMQSALYCFAGSINKLNVDDKGITLVAAMGLPPLSHKDDAARAVHAALAMRNALIALNRPCAIGIATGWDFCGPIGSDFRREYTVVGNSVNRAARLMQVAEERRKEQASTSYILCDEATFQAVADEDIQDIALSSRLVFEHHTGVELKGRPEPVTAYRPHLQKQLPRKSGPRTTKSDLFIGRNRSRSSLMNALQDLKSSESYHRLLMIEGEEGIGKSELLRSFLVDAEAAGISIYMGEGKEYSQTAPFHAWRPIFNSLFDIDLAHDDIGSQRRKIMRKLPVMPGEKGFPATALRLTPLLNDISGLEFAENRLTKAIPDDVKAQTTRLFLVRLLQQSLLGRRGRNTRPLVIVLDNGQWLDGESLRLAGTATNLIRPLLVVIASRQLHSADSDQTMMTGFRNLISDDGFQRLTLEPLSDSEISGLITSWTAPCLLTEDILQTLWQTVGGNPYLNKLMIRHWQDLGLICSNEPGQEPTLARVDDEPLPVPNSVYKIIMGRIDLLIPEQQMVLKAASQLDRQFTMEKLQDVVSKTWNSLTASDQLEALSDLGLIVQSPGRIPESYQFAYDVIRDVARGLLPEDQRGHFQAFGFRAS